MLRMLLLGAPGVGKGTQGQLLATAMSLPYLGTGELMRAELERATPRAATMRADINAGRLVPDELAMEIIGERVVQNEGGFILDGFPRTLAQARSLDKLVKPRLMEIDAVIRFQLDESEIFRRLSLRRRADDEEATVRGRLDTYFLNEEEIVNHYRGRIVELDASGDKEMVFDRLLEAVTEVVPR